MIKTRKLIVRVIVWLIIIAMVAAFVIEIALAAEQAIPSTPPQNIAVADIGYEGAGGQNWYVKFEWNAPYYPDEATGDKSQTFYFNRIQRGTGEIQNDILEFTLNHTDTSLVTTSYGIELDHGTIYEFYGRSKYTYGDLGQYTFISGRSNKVKFLTDVEFGAELISGTNDIKIVWDDVWDTGGRINYRILISDTSGFTQPPSIPDIIGSDIGTQNSRVTVSGNRLEYIYTNALPGREYSIKVIPLVSSDVATIPEEEIPVVRVKTEIILRAKKLGETDEEARWMLFWDPIIKGSIGSPTFTRVEYKLYRYDQTGVETFFALVTDSDRFEMSLKRGEEGNYQYKVEAVAYKPDGGTVPFYSTTLVTLKEQIPEYPSAPEFVNSFPTADPAPLVFDELLTDTSATLLWSAPVTGDGKIDDDIYYDLYLVDNLEDLESLPITKRIATNMTMGAQNEVREKETNRLIGYRYRIDYLKPNSVYYAVLIAKKNFLIESEGFMLTKPYLSKPSTKVIITRPSTEADRPVAPASPPFRLKPGESPAKTGFTLQMEKSWTEMYHAGMQKWLYVIGQDDPEGHNEGGFYNETNSFTYEQYIHNSNLPDGDQNKKPERVVEYKAGWEIDIHCVDYAQALRVIEELKDRDYITYSDLKQGYILALDMPIAPVAIPDIDPRDPQVFSMPVTGLEPNKTYLVWITVISKPGNLESDPSDPIIVTTQPDYPPVIETPVVPTDLKGIPTDTYVDLFWTFWSGYSYNICYGTEDDRTKAIGTVNVTYEQLRYQPWYRIGPLQADTVYYFWIQAVAPVEQGTTVLSDWSNPVLVKTEAFRPPPTPRGFGIKNVPDGITQTSIFYEWMPDETVSYILELSETADFAEVVEYRTDAYEYQVTGLKSNYRYFARLFAYSAETGLRSEPTKVVMVVTRRGRGEYDADVPIEDIPPGEIVVIDGVAIDGIWSTKVTGINSHRLSEKIRQSGTMVFSIDLTVPPPSTSIIRLELDGEVLETLSGVNKSIIMRTPGFDIMITPGSFLQDDYFRLKQRLGNITVRVDVRTPVHELAAENRRQFVMPVTEMKVMAGLGNSYLPLGYFTRPVKVTIPVQNPDIMEKIVVRFYDTGQRKWDDIHNIMLFADKKIAAYMQKSGAVAATIVKAENFQDTDQRGTEKTVQRILQLYEMPSLPSGQMHPNKELSVAEGMMHLFDIIPYDYNNENVIEKALRAGLLLRTNANNTGTFLRKDEAIFAAMMILGKKTGTQAVADIDILTQYADFNEIYNEYRPAIAYAAINGIIDTDRMLYPDKNITRAELLSVIEKVLMLAGEL